MLDFEVLNLGEGDDIREYRILRMPILKGGKFAAQIAKVIAPALSENKESITKLFNEVTSSKDGTKEGLEGLLSGQMDLIIEVLSGSLGSVDVDKLYDLGIKAMQHESYAAGIKMDDKHLNSHFKKHPADLIKVMAFAIRVNCSGFFGIGGQS